MGNNIKFYSKNLIDDNATFSFTSANTAFAHYLYDNQRNNKVISLTSNDTTNEVWTITLNGTQAFDTIFIDNHNIKSGTLKYWNGSAYADFSTPIAWTANTSTTNLYSFTAVNTNSVQLTMSTTQLTNAQKYVGELRLFSLIGELVKNPSSINNLEFYRKKTVNETVAGGNILTLYGNKFKVSFTLNDATETDVSLIENLANYAFPFYIHMCGGLTTYTQRGFRIQDMFFVNYINDFIPQLKENILDIGTIIEVELWEV